MKTATLRLALAGAAMVLASAGALAQNATIDNLRPYDKSGINVFESPKSSSDFDGLRWRMGFNFVQPLQMLEHESGASQTVAATTLKEIGTDFNTAVANWNVDAQLAKGVRLSVTTYLSARHHQETWVKGGFIQFDELPFLPFGFVEDVMEYTTIRVGHMQVNYGDAQFRRSDNGNVVYNPFVENYLLDAFATEIGAEVLVRHSGFLGLVGVTNGEIKGDVGGPKTKAPAFLFKGGYDAQLNEDLRVRLTGSLYMTEKASNGTLYDGDRGGSHYYYVLENAAASATAQFTSGRINPNLDSKLTAFVINPFVKFQGLELFGNIEFANGTSKSADNALVLTPTSTKADSATRTAQLEEREWMQIAGDVVYRFGSTEQFWVGARYNTATGKPFKYTQEVEVSRIAASLGWFMTDAIMAKIEYVSQDYGDKWATTDTKYKGKFNGIMIEASVGF
ncbi:MAG: hypothetical protein HUU10_07900 [Bacteroidetes bacterium]|nr:hypothetical protein [Bacteroidota bacterium]